MAAEVPLKGLFAKLRSKATEWPERIELARKILSTSSYLLPNRLQLLLEWVVHALSNIELKSFECPPNTTDSLWTILHQILSEKLPGDSQSLEIPGFIRNLLAEIFQQDKRNLSEPALLSVKAILDNNNCAKALTSKFNPFVELTGLVTNYINCLLCTESHQEDKYLPNNLELLLSILCRFKQQSKQRINQKLLVTTFCKKLLHCFISLHYKLNEVLPVEDRSLCDLITKAQFSITDVVSHVLCQEVHFVGYEEEHNKHVLRDAYEVINKAVNENPNLAPSIIHIIGQIYEGILTGNQSWKLLSKIALLELFKELLKCGMPNSSSSLTNETKNGFYVDLCSVLLPLLVRFEVCTTSGNTEFESMVTGISLIVAENLFGCVENGKAVKQMKALDVLLSVSHVFAEAHMLNVLKLCLIVPEDAKLSQELETSKSVLFGKLIQTYSQLKQIDRFIVLFLDAMYYITRLINHNTEVRLPLGFTAILQELVLHSVPSTMVSVLDIIVGAMNQTFLPLSDGITPDIDKKCLNVIELLFSFISVILQNIKGITPSEYTGKFDESFMKVLQKLNYIREAIDFVLVDFPADHQLSLCLLSLSVGKMLMEVTLALLHFGYDGAFINLSWIESLGCFLPESLLVKSVIPFFDNKKLQYILAELFIYKCREMMLKNAIVFNSYKDNIFSRQLDSLQDDSFESWNHTPSHIAENNFGTALVQLLCSNFVVVVDVLRAESLQLFCTHLGRTFVSRDILMAENHGTQFIVQVSTIATSLMNLPVFYDMKELQIDFINVILTVIGQSIFVNKDNVFCQIATINKEQNFKTSCSNKGEDQFEDIEVGVCSFLDEPKKNLVFNKTLMLAITGEISPEKLNEQKKVLHNMKPFLVLFQDIDVDKLQPSTLAKLICSCIFLLRLTNYLDKTSEAKTLQTACLQFIYKTSSFAVDRSQGSCWNLLDCRQILRWILQPTNQANKTQQVLLNVIGRLSAVAIKFGGHYNRLSLEEAFKPLVIEITDNTDSLPQNLEIVHEILGQAVTILRRKPTSEMARVNSLEIASLFNIVLLQMINYKWNIHSWDIASALAGTLEIYGMLHALNDVFDGEHLTDPAFENAVSLTLTMIDSLANEATGNHVSPLILPNTMNFLRVLLGSVPCLKVLNSQNGEFWKKYSKLLLHFLVSPALQNIDQMTLKCESIFELFHSCLKNVSVGVREDILNLLFEFLVSGFRTSALRAKAISLWEYLVCCEWKKEQRGFLKPVASRLFLACVQFLSDPSTTEQLGIYESLIIILIKLASIGHGILTSLAVMSSLSIFSRFQLSSGDTKSCKILLRIYELLSILMYKYTSVVEPCIHSFLGCMRSLLVAILDLVTNPELKDNNKKLVADCVVYMGRLYQEFGSHKEIFVKYTPYLLSHYLRAIKNVRIPTDMQAYLTSGIYAVLDSCGEHQFSLLHAVLGPGERELFQELYSDYLKHYKFQGKA